MASKFMKCLLFTAASCAACAGVYYYMQKKNAEARQRYGYDEDEDFDDFDEDLDGEPCRRSYVSLNFDNAGAFASEAYRRAKEKITEVKDTVLAGLEGASVGMREFVDLTREEANVCDAFASHTTDIIDEVADEIVKGSKKADEQLSKKAHELGDDAIELAGKAKKAAKETIKDAEDGLKAADRAVDKAEEAVTDAIKEGVTKVEDFFDEE